MDTATILTSAGVAGMVTLGIEYAAKPRLEARKERILGEHRTRAHTVEQLNAAWGTMAGIASMDLRLAKTDEVREIAMAEAERLRADLSVFAGELFRCGSQFPADDEVALEFLFRVAAAARAMVVAPLTPGRELPSQTTAEFEWCRRLVEDCHGTPWSRRRDRREALRWIKEHPVVPLGFQDTPKESSPSGA